jgi:hypothetical protein
VGLPIAPRDRLAGGCLRDHSHCRIPSRVEWRWAGNGLRRGPGCHSLTGWWHARTVGRTRPD